MGPPPVSSPATADMGPDGFEEKSSGMIMGESEEQLAVKRKVASLAVEAQNAYLLFRDLCTICRGEPSIKVCPVNNSFQLTAMLVLRGCITYAVYACVI